MAEMFLSWHFILHLILVLLSSCRIVFQTKLIIFRTRDRVICLANAILNVFCVILLLLIFFCSVSLFCSACVLLYVNMCSVQPTQNNVFAPENKGAKLLQNTYVAIPTFVRIQAIHP